MKRGKDDDKIGGPMFPRLHINDTEKGGPRAPPRNKMALYEQLSIPSQRFNSGVLPVNSSSTTNSGRPASSNQAGGKERGTIFPLQLPQSMHPVEKANSCCSDVNNQLIQQELKKKQDEDDFRVPIFVQSGSNQDCRGNHHMKDREGHTPILTPAPATSAYTGRLGKHHIANERAPKQRDATDLNLRPEGISQSEENSQGVLVGLEQSVKSASNQMFRQGSRDPLKHFIDASKSCSLSRSNGAIQHDLGVEAQRDSTVWGDSVSTEAIRVVDYRNSSIPTRESQQEMLRSPNEPTNGDAVSETSMVDSVSGIDISPDDVVGIIGQKHFWKARRAIVNQQRVFAVQVFELHRLIKVQKLIAGSPQLLVEELGKPVEVSPAKKLPLEYIVKSTPTISKHNEDECKNADQNMEFSAENAMEKASLSSVQFPNYKQFPGNLLPTSDPKMGPWSFNQQLGHQWLIPVMTPSEGLVYKPYSGPGFMSPVCGGIGPPRTPLMVGHNFPNYGVPPSHHHYQGHGVPPFAPPPSHGYFPAYAMPPMNSSISNSAGEQMNHFNMQYESSCNAPSEKHGTAVPNVSKFHAFKDSELQVSTASSPSERTQGRNALPLFPTSPVVHRQDGIPNQPHNADQPVCVIKVVPHTARSANASVARIFQSIQEERKQL